MWCLRRYPRQASTVDRHSTTTIEAWTALPSALPGVDGVHTAISPSLSSNAKSRNGAPIIGALQKVGTPYSSKSISSSGASAPKNSTGPQRHMSDGYCESSERAHSVGECTRQLLSSAACCCTYPARLEVVLAHGSAQDQALVSVTAAREVQVA